MNRRIERIAAAGGVAGVVTLAVTLSGVSLAETGGSSDPGPIAGGLRAQVAQASDISGEIRQLRQEVQMLQSFVFRDSGEAAAEAATPQAAAVLAVRLQAVESQMRDLTGRMEEFGFRLGNLEQRIDHLVGDLDRRLEPLEARPAPGHQARTATAAASAAANANAAAVEGVEQPAAPAPQRQILPEGDDRQQYNACFGLLRQGDYPTAETCLTAFLQQNPESDLTCNARYWLGETHYVRQDFASGAIAFAEGYELCAASAKAPDNLLKLGMSLSRLGENGEACKAFAQLEKQFPNTQSNIKLLTDREKQRAECG